MGTGMLTFIDVPMELLTTMATALTAPPFAPLVETAPRWLMGGKSTDAVVGNALRKCREERLTSRYKMAYFDIINTFSLI